MFDNFWFGVILGVAALWAFQRWQAKQSGGR